MDRQDIDALLIGALYGELTPADEARLTAHLESHPTDRSALEDLKVARQAVADSRIFAVQLDPPQHVSALLLQEAHRRAPKRVVVADEKESWFYRFTRSFMAHPAMAAAAMLVLVLGGAGIVYMKKGDQFAEKQVAAPQMEAASPSSVAVADTPAAQGSAVVGGAAGSAYSADLYEGGDMEKEADKAAPAPEASAAQRWEGQRQSAAAEAKLEKAPSRAIAVTTQKGEPKELERAKGRAAKNDSPLGYDSLGAADRGGAPGTATGGGAATASTRSDGNIRDQKYAQPPPPSAPTATASATTGTAAPRPADAPAKVATQKSEASKDTTLIAWAKSEHARAVALAQKGDCSAAAKAALSVSTRASEYYAQFMATDRALKQCAQYINAERDREAERAGKARAQKRVNADEAPPSATTK